MIQIFSADGWTGKSKVVQEVLADLKRIIKSKELRNRDEVSCLLCVLGQMKSETKMEASRVKFLVVYCCYDTGIEMSLDGS